MGGSVDAYILSPRLQGLVRLLEGAGNADTSKLIPVYSKLAAILQPYAFLSCN
jgi:hypothetical protein